MAKNLRAIVDQMWIHLDDNSETSAADGAVTIELTGDQARELYLLYWKAGGEYRASLRDCGWTPPTVTAPR